jgi:hypothetical protein
MNGLLPHRALRLGLITCAILTGALLLLPASRALGADGERPAISGVTAVYGPEGDATLEAQIDPEGSEPRTNSLQPSANLLACARHRVLGC